MEPPPVTTARIRPSRPVWNPVTAVPVRTSMPMPSIARCTVGLMSGSSVVIGSAA